MEVHPCNRTSMQLAFDAQISSVRAQNACKVIHGVCLDDPVDVRGASRDVDLELAGCLSQLGHVFDDLADCLVAIRVNHCCDCRLCIKIGCQVVRIIDLSDVFESRHIERRRPAHVFMDWMS